MARSYTRDRVTITLSVPMRLALDALRARHGLPLATEATMLLRQGLDRTIQSAEVQELYRQHKAQRTAGDWRQEVQVDHAVETTFTRYQPEA